MKYFDLQSFFLDYFLFDLFFLRHGLYPRLALISRVAKKNLELKNKTFVRFVCVCTPV